MRNLTDETTCDCGWQLPLDVSVGFKDSNNNVSEVVIIYDCPVCKTGWQITDMEQEEKDITN